MTTGRPLWWLRAEGLALLAAALLLYGSTHQHWWLVPAAILLPDLLMAGYLGGTTIGAAAYNLAHAYPLPAVWPWSGSAGTTRSRWRSASSGLPTSAWTARMGYGLKYDDHFQHTHLGQIGHSQNEATS